MYPKWSFIYLFFNFLEIRVLRVSRVFVSVYPRPYDHPEFRSGDSASCKLLITNILTDSVSPSDFQMAERENQNTPKHSLLFLSGSRLCHWKVHKHDGPDCGLK